MPSQPQLATFKPLRGGWYRCNQTGDRTRRPKIYGRSYDGDALKKYNDAHRPVVVLPPIPPPPTALKSARIDVGFGDVRCPACFLHTPCMRTGPIACRYCDERFMAV